MAKLQRDHKIAFTVVAVILTSALFYPLLFKPGPDDWSKKELAVLASLHIRQLPAVPQDPSNAYENLPAAIQLGQQIFNDLRFSKNQEVSCAHCHQARLQFQDNKRVGEGIAQTRRRTPALLGVAYHTWLFWDGRKDSLWSQALEPLESDKEHGSNRLQIAHLIQRHYQTGYEAIFGPLPALQQLVANASPNGTPTERAAWAALTPLQQNQVNRVFVNVGKALAAYEKTLQISPAPLDAYITAVTAVQKKDKSGLTAISLEQKRGLRLFIGMGQCITCHNGPLLTDKAFHNIGVPDPGGADPGRAQGWVQVEKDEFNCMGPYSDAKPSQCSELRFMSRDGDSLRGSFKTPGLRNVALRPPYMHQGQFASLEQVITHYAKAPAAITGHNERHPMPMKEQEVADLVAFLKTLSSSEREKKLN
jgi:cytochrome c peroxidase